ncbi:hypothetical protein E2C01_085475 [Portunus trituberculatus]|uniref:Uncharacterized protein n=1 Tax=Portunus trituberculatus TaxID=210409 RepID=A0A5B7J8Z6_PORTR|nr:hypothetical protein [Portunus trituberculatus]
MRGQARCSSSVQAGETTHSHCQSAEDIHFLNHLEVCRMSSWSTSSLFVNDDRYAKTMTLEAVEKGTCHHFPCVN